MYVSPNFRTKKALKLAIADGQPVTVYQPGPFGGGSTEGQQTVEGPHYPEPHKWYAQIIVKNGLVTKVIQ